MLHYADGRPAAVEPANVPLEEGFVLDEMGEVVSYKGTTVEDVREMRRVQGLEDVRGEKKRRFQEMRRKFDNMERSSQATLAEERRLRDRGREVKEGPGEAVKVEG